MLLRLVICFALVAGLSSCATMRNKGTLIADGVSDVSADFKQSGRALVVVAVRHRRKTNIVDYYVEGRPRFVRKNMSGDAFSRFHEAGNDTLVGVVDAGTWALESVTPWQSRYPIAPLWDPATGKATIFGFSVQPGDIVYLGHVDYMVTAPPRNALTFVVSDYGAEARAALNELLPDVAAGISRQMKTRLVDVRARY
jgi:hypothetical protein